MTGTLGELRRDGLCPDRHAQGADRLSVGRHRAGPLRISAARPSRCRAATPPRLIAQGIASVQTYMQRCRLQLEPGVAEVAIPEIWWEWLSSYRPSGKPTEKSSSIRKTTSTRRCASPRTPLFEEYEGKVGGNEVNEATIDEAYTEFMKQLRPAGGDPGCRHGSRDSSRPGDRGAG